MTPRLLSEIEPGRASRRPGGVLKVALVRDYRAAQNRSLGKGTQPLRSERRRATLDTVLQTANFATREGQRERTSDLASDWNLAWRSSGP